MTPRKKTSFSFCKKNKVLNKVLCKQTVNNMLNICSWTDNNSNKKPTQKSPHFQELLEHCNDCINSMLAELKKTHPLILQSTVWTPREPTAIEKSDTSMLVTDVGDQMFWWQVWDVDDRFRMLVTDLIHWENHQHNGKINNIMILPPTSQIGHHHKVTSIKMSPTSLSPKNRMSS